MTNPSGSELRRPTFRTERLFIRPRVMADTEACLAMDRDPAVVRHVRGPWDNPTAHRAFIEEQTRGPYPPGLGYWTVLCAEKDSFIGWMLLIPVDVRGPEIEIGWRLVRAAWGRGYATEAAIAILRYAFATLGVPQVIAEIDPANVASTRVAQKIGLRPRAVVRPDGDRAVRYALTGDQYASVVRPEFAN